MDKVSSPNTILCSVCAEAVYLAHAIISYTSQNLIEVS
jgi:hypothetical protein